MTTQLNESLKYLDMENQMIPTLGIDQYSSKIGDDNEFITLDFTVRSKACAGDLVVWLERGYEWIIDAEASPGEVTRGKFLVFAEIKRRQRSAEQIIDLINDLETLTGLTSEEWQLKITDNLYPATAESIKEHIELSPHDYRAEHEDELNEMRVIAGLEPTHNTYESDDSIKLLQRQAGLI